MMSKEFVAFFMQVFAFALGGFAAFLLGFKLLWPRVESFLFKLKLMHRDGASDKDFRQLKFAAYERLLVLVQRMEPMQVLVRQHQEHLSLPVFVSLVMQDIEAEFQHNFTQQLYVSDKTWSVVTELKDNTVNLLRNVSDAVGDKALVDQYVAQVLKHVRDLDVDPYEAAQRVIKREMQL